MQSAQQLSLDVHPHPHLIDQDGGLLVGTLKVSGEYRVDRDLNAGDELMIVVQSADGEVIAHHKATVGAVALVPIEDKDVGFIGTERAHKAKVTE